MSAPNAPCSTWKPRSRQQAINFSYSGMATAGGAQVLGRDDIGSLEVGKAGDLFAIDTRRLEMVGADLDPKSLLGTVGWKGPVDYTVVNGKVTVRSGKLVNLDEEKAAREAAALVRDYLSR